ncbi:FxsA family protein, partial [Nocardia asiatica]|uniref:FxsA family protein n=1 Tax=Nocardia asiatica TaxID=209252 RepID=UPI002458FB3C
MPALLFVLYVVVEVATLVAVGQLIGVLPTVLVLIAGSAAGLLLVGAQGRRVFEQFRRAARGEVAPGAPRAAGPRVAAGGGGVLVAGQGSAQVGRGQRLPA